MDNFSQNILSHLEKLAVNAKDYPDFQKKALAMLGLSDTSYKDINLEIDQKDRELGNSLGLSPTSQVIIPSDAIDRFLPETLFRLGNLGRLKSLWDNFR